MICNYIVCVSVCVCNKVIDFNKFEEMFKLGNLTLEDIDADTMATSKQKTVKKIETISLLEANRMRNVGE